MKKIDSKKIAIIGSGVVGQASGKGLKNVGHEITFYDINLSIIESLREIGYDADHIDNLSRRSDEYDAFMISISTPTIKEKADLTSLGSALHELGKKIKKMKNFSIVVVRSTVPPGTSENFVSALLENISKKKVNVHFGICMNPEFLREVSSEKDFNEQWLTVIGSNDKVSGLLLEKIYRPFRSPVVHMSLMEAEMMKYVHNLFNATKISFFNEMRIVCKKIGVDPDVVFRAAVKSAEGSWNPEYGIRDMGCFSGACLPKDTRAFYTWSTRYLGFDMPVLRGTIETNNLVKEKTVEQEITAKVFQEALQ